MAVTKVLQTVRHTINGKVVSFYLRQWLYERVLVSFGRWGGEGATPVLGSLCVCLCLSVLFSNRAATAMNCTGGATLRIACV